MKVRGVWIAGLASWLLPLTALAWEPFRSPNSLVEEGNELLAQEKTADALDAYTRAAKELPDRAGVHLNRGLALTRAGELEAAGEAFEQATRGRGDEKVRSDSYYNLGRTRFAQANQLADADDLKGAQSLLADARDALRQSLRAQPGSRDAAWNLELVQRRMVELKEEQKKQEQEQEQEDQDQQDQGEQDQDQQDQGEQDQEQDPQDGESGDDSDESQEQDGGDEGSSPEDSEPQKPEQDPEPEGGEQPQEAEQPPSPEPDSAEQPPPEPGEAQNEPLPQHVRQVLDSLQDSEETLQRHQAHSRARSRPRRVEKDW